MPIRISQIENLSGPMLKSTLVRKLYDAIQPVVQGFFDDESWQAPRAVWETFNKLGLDWNITDSYYGGGRHDRTLPPESKTWKFEIRFTNKRGRPDTVYGVLTAAGAGSVEDPLDRYDVTVVMSESSRYIKTAKDWKDKIPGGFADDKEPKDFDPEQLAKGLKIEMEHTDDPLTALEISMDHQVESKDVAGNEGTNKGGKYYDLLENMETKIKSRLKSQKG